MIARALLVLLVTPVLLAGCDSGSASNDTVKQEAKFQGQVGKAKGQVIGYPKVKHYAESANLKRRYEEVDDPKATGYIYLIDHGLVFAEYTVQGKVSSLNSNFTNPERETGPHESRVTLPQAEPDGSYGDNPEGIFFWTTDGIYVEWAGTYLYAKKRLEIQQPAQNIVAKQVP